MEEELEIFEKYLNGKLDPLETQQLEERLSKEPLLKNRLDLFRDMRGAILPDTDNFKKALSRAENDYLASQQNRRKFNPWLTGLAAAFTILAIFSVFYFTTGNETPQTLYTTYYEVPPENISMRRIEESDQLAEIVKLYNDGAYSQAKVGFEELMKENPEDESLLFYTAICQMETGAYSDAEELFRRLLSNGESNYLTVSQWYLGLTLLKLNKPAEAKFVLKDLSTNDQSSYAEDASDLLNELQ